jgi:DNA invertase Pin-like site-specific DNA recombinase
MITTIDALSLALAKNPGAVTWAYCRVSTDKQEANQSFETQANDIRALAVERGLPEPLVVCEVGSAAKPCFAVRMPGTPKDDPLQAQPRPLFALLISALSSERKGSRLLVWKLDRMSRVLHEQELILDLMTRQGIAIISTMASEADVLGSGAGDPSRTMMRQIMGAVAQYERALIRLRMEAGLRTKAAKGGWLGGRPAYGYDIVGNDLVVDPVKAEVVRTIFRMRDFEILSHQNIAVALVEQCNQPGWNRMRVRRVLASRGLYAGTYEDHFGVSHPRPDLRILPSSWGADGVPAN